MDIEATKTAATQLLDSYYQIHTSDLPTQRTKSQWQAENKRGFFLGIIQEGEDSHIIRLHHLLATNQFTQQQEFSTTSQLQTHNILAPLSTTCLPTTSYHSTRITATHPPATLRFLQPHHQEATLPRIWTMSRMRESRPTRI